MTVCSDSDLASPAHGCPFPFPQPPSHLFSLCPNFAPRTQPQTKIIKINPNALKFIGVFHHPQTMASQCGKKHQSPRHCRARVVAAATFDSSRDAASSCALLKPSQNYWRVCGCLQWQRPRLPHSRLPLPFSSLARSRSLRHTRFSLCPKLAPRTLPQTKNP